MSAESISSYEQMGALKSALGIAVASLAIAACESDAAQAYPAGLGSTNSEGAFLTQVLSFSPKTGETECTYQRSDQGTNFGSQSILMRIEALRGKKWKINTDFVQPFASSEPQADPHSVTTTLSHTYPLKRLQKSDAKLPQRIVCLDSENEIALPVRFKRS